MRRFATRTTGANGGSNHLDADEMNAFAEGVLPAPTRAYYVSHLADCDQCRRQVADLAIASGAVARAEPTLVDKGARLGVWASVTRLFAAPALRYAAFAAVLVVVAGVAFVALRQRSKQPTDLVARNEGDQPRAYEPTPAAGSSSAVPNQSDGRAPTSNSLPTPAATQSPASPPQGGLFREEARPADTTTTAPVEPMKENSKVPEIAAKKAEAPAITNTFPYSPAPPNEKQGLGQGQAQGAGVAPAPGGPRQQQNQNQSLYVLQSKAQSERDALAKDARLDDRDRKADQTVIAGRANDEKLKGGPSRNIDNMANNNRSSNEILRSEAPKTRGTDSEDKSETRSASGHKFRRQGNAWVDQKFKSSMSLKNIARGSDEFSSLDSGIRSIAQQIGGEVIVVWKGKAYLIK